MRPIRVSKLSVAIATTMLGTLSLAAQTAPEMEQIANTMVRLCVGGGRTEVVSAGGTASRDFSLRSLDSRGALNGEVKITRSSAEGLVEGLNSALNKVAADQADKVRACLQPVRERLLDLLLPKQSPSNENSIEQAAKALSRGRMALKMDDPDLAIAESNEAIRLNPNYANAFNIRGLAFVKKHVFGNAIDSYSEAIRLKGNESVFYYNRG